MNDTDARSVNITVGLISESSAQRLKVSNSLKYSIEICVCVLSCRYEYFTKKNIFIFFRKWEIQFQLEYFLLTVLILTTVCC